jgi:hypothetical protein
MDAQFKEAYKSAGKAVPKPGQKIYPKCVDCKFHTQERKVYSNSRHICLHPTLADLVTGDPTNCEHNRKNGALCDRYGKHWTAK